MHKFLASLSTLLLLLTLSPLSAFATENETTTEPEENRYLVQITWGKTNYKNELETTEANVDFSGYVESNNQIFLQETLRFEGNDSVKNKVGTKINYKSSIKNGIDGLVLNVTDTQDSYLTLYNNYLGENKVSFKKLSKDNIVTIKKSGYNLNIKLLNKTESTKVLAQKSQNSPYILEITWVNLKNNTNISKDPVKVNGSIYATNASIKIISPFLLEENDYINKSKNTWETTVQSHQDGFLALVTPEQNKIPEITLEVNRKNNLIKNNSTLSTFHIKDNYYIETKKIAKYQSLKNLELSNKIEIRELLGNLEKNFPNISDDCRTSIQEINNYSIINTEDPTLINFIENINQISPEDTPNIQLFCQGLKPKFESVKDQYIKTKYQSGLIPFKDTDDNQWYTPYVAQLKDTTWNNQKIVEGFKDGRGNPTGQYGPDQYLKLGEVLKIAMILGDHEQLKLGAPTNTLSHWAVGYLGRARQLQFESTKSITTFDQLNSPATRGQAFLILAEATNMIDESSTAQVECQNQNFQDIDLSSKETAAACIFANLGIISGTDNNQLKLDSSINRAEIAKVVVNIINIYLNSNSEYQADDLSKIDPDGVDTKY